MEPAIVFEVRGAPVAQGSTRAFIPKGWNRPIITSTAKGLKQWRQLVADVAQRHAPPAPWEGPVVLELAFRMPKPKSEPKRRRTWPDRKPDLDKLCRSIMDALTHVFYNGDQQVVRLVADKDWGVPGVWISVRRQTEGPPRLSEVGRNIAEKTRREIVEGRM